MKIPEKIARTKILRKDGIWVNVYFASLTMDEARKMKKPEWKFNWAELLEKKDMQVYKMCIEETDNIEGAIILQIQQNMVWVEDAEKPSFKTNRDYKKVIAALFAFACKLSQEHGGKGYIGFKPKNDVLKKYYEKIGAEWVAGLNWAIFDKKAFELINEYYGNTR